MPVKMDRRCRAFSVFHDNRSPGIYSVPPLVKASCQLFWRSLPRLAIMLLQPNSTLPDPSENFLPSVGPVLIGAILSWWLYGVLIMQLYVYHLVFPEDTIWIKIVAYGLFLLDTIHSLIVTDVAWKMLCRGWGKSDSLIKTDWAFAMIPMIDSLIPMWVHAFYAWRLWVLGRNLKWKIFTAGILMLSLGMEITGIGSSIKYAAFNDIRKIRVIESLAFAWLCSGALVDTLIATSMAYLLLAARRQANWSKATGRKLTNMIRLSVEMGMVSAVFAILDLIFFVGSKSNIHITFAFVTAKLYSNSLMASLNSRAGVYERYDPSPREVDLENTRNVTMLEHGGIKSEGLSTI
ncbi:hypothetical protein B0F90DRAFT_1744313 [Multifurca ochricompacta]|uniref:DUF6534 domain-containing protein n=1 Tax=Multifurca ochricompacta TaxID=376703 RepID=A0AAD4LZK4_9AGAM|nr:hypothetical protein B0F90DRAFT_1744313 [Multifurca ochricompacta]